MAFYNVEYFKNGIKQLLKHMEGSPDVKLLKELESDEALALGDPNVAVAGIGMLLDRALECDCSKCGIIASMCQITVTKFARAMERIIDEKDIHDREELLTKELSIAYGSFPAIMDAALTAHLMTEPCAAYSLEEKVVEKPN